jgi:prophage maintenance system killer protein
MEVNIFEFRDDLELMKLIERIENLSLKLNEFDTDQLVTGSKRLSEFRVISSGTIQKQGHHLWSLANLYITDKVNLGLAPTWIDICEVNKILDPDHKGCIRTCEVYIGNHQACEVKELNNYLNRFTKDILINKNLQNPLLWASKVRYWLVTLHPFIDANGRTSNLICDWILALNGFLPISYNSKVDSLIGGWKGRSHFSDLNYATFKTLTAVEHSYQFFY